MKPIIFNWPATTGNEEAICKSSAAISNSTYNLKLNSNEIMGDQLSGAFVFASVTPMDFGNNDFYRTISISSDGDLSESTITIYGIGFTISSDANDVLTVENGFNESIVETLDGPNNEKVFSTNYYKKINKIEIQNGLVTSNISVGFGNSGITDPMYFGRDKIYDSISAQIDIFNKGADAGTCYWYFSNSYEQVGNYFTNTPFLRNKIVCYPKSANIEENSLIDNALPHNFNFFHITENTTAEYNFSIIQQG